jgi:hypothetical protein
LGDDGKELPGLALQGRQGQGASGAGYQSTDRYHACATFDFGSDQFELVRLQYSL